MRPKKEILNDFLNSKILRVLRARFLKILWFLDIKNLKNTNIGRLSNFTFNNPIIVKTFIILFPAMDHTNNHRGHLLSKK